MRASAHQPSPEYLRIASLPLRELEKLLVRGETPDAEALAGWVYRGMNNLAVTKVLGIKKFMKGFFRDVDGQVFGYNIPVEQNAPHAPWIPKKPGRVEKMLGKRGENEPKRFGFYAVTPVDATSKDNHYLHALLLDYGRGGNPALDPSGNLRDYLVRVENGSDDLLLGKAYFAAGPARLDLMSFFVLERDRPSDFRR